MQTVIVIPARFQSSRFPGKPLALIRGHSLLYRTWSLAKAVTQVEAVVIATDDERIASHAQSFGAQVVITGSCYNGSERVLQALIQLGWRPQHVINLQGDAMLTPPWVIQRLVDFIQASPEVEVATLATPFTKAHYQCLREAQHRNEIRGTTVVFNQHYEALYFSKGLLPFIRNQRIENPSLYRHIGLYAYRYAALVNYLQLSPTPLEDLEGLEQLRLLEHGIPIRVLPVDYRGRTHAAIDNPNDIAEIETLIQQEGELVVL